MKKYSLRRLVENEKIFREQNEAVVREVDTAEQQAKEQGYKEANSDDVSLHFYCECSNDGCRARIVLSVKQYRQIHANRDMFIVVPSHEILEIEEVVARNDGYNVVKKLTAIAQ